jgi:hypothetical protein
MKLFGLVIAAVAVLGQDAEPSDPQDCKCPTLIYDDMGNNECFGDNTECQKVIKLPACCEKVRMVPGGKCDLLTSCGQCTNLDACRWNRQTNKCIAVLEQENPSDYIVKQCDATLTGLPEYLPIPPPDKLPGLGRAAANFDQKPEIVADHQWPLFTNGYLGPGCKPKPQILNIPANPPLPPCPTDAYVAALIEE